MIATVFVDTNVLLQSHQAADPVRQQVAAHWLEYLWIEQAGRISMQVISEYYVTLTQRIRPALPAADAWDHVQTLLAWAPLPIDAPLLQRARQVEAKFRLNWWDSLIVAAAQAQGCTLLLSEDLEENANYDGVTVRNPFRLSIDEAAATYARPSSLPSRRRQRGRPRRLLRTPS